MRFHARIEIIVDLEFISFLIVVRFSFLKRLNFLILNNLEIVTGSRILHIFLEIRYFYLHLTSHKKNF